MMTSCAAATLMVAEVPLIEGDAVSVAVTVWLPEVVRVTENLPAPLVSREFAASTALLSVLVRCTVPE